MFDSQDNPKFDPEVLKRMEETLHDKLDDAFYTRNDLNDTLIKNLDSPLVMWLTLQVTNLIHDKKKAQDAALSVSRDYSLFEAEREHFLKLLEKNSAWRQIEEHYDDKVRYFKKEKQGLRAYLNSFPEKVRMEREYKAYKRRFDKARECRNNEVFNVILPSGHRHHLDWSTFDALDEQIHQRWLKTATDLNEGLLKNVQRHIETFTKRRQRRWLWHTFQDWLLGFVALTVLLEFILVSWTEHRIVELTGHMWHPKVLQGLFMLVLALMTYIFTKKFAEPRIHRYLVKLKREQLHADIDEAKETQLKLEAMYPIIDAHLGSNTSLEPKRSDDAESGDKASGASVGA